MYISVFDFCLALKALIRGEVPFASVTDIAMPRNPFSSVVIYHRLLMILLQSLGTNMSCCIFRCCNDASVCLMPSMQSLVPLLQLNTWAVIL